MSGTTLSRRSVLAASGASALLGGRVGAEDSPLPADNGPFDALVIEPGWAGKINSAGALILKKVDKS